MRLRIIHLLVITIIGVLAPQANTYCQSDTIGLAQALANVEELRAEKRSDELVQSLKVLAARYLIDLDLTEMAIIAYKEAIDVQKIYKDSTSQYLIHIDLAILYIMNDRYNEAINLLSEAADYFKHHELTEYYGIALNFTGDTYIAAADPERAVSYVTEAKNMALPTSLLNKLNSNTVTSLIRNGISIEGQEEPDTTAVERSPLRTRLDFDYSGLPALNSGLYQMRNDNIALADLYLVKAIQSTTDGVILRDGLKYLAEIHEQISDYELAYYYLNRYSIVSDSLLNDKRQQIINRLRIQMQSYEQQAKISELEKEKNVAVIVNRMQKIGSVSLLIGSLIILFAAYFIIRNYQKRLNANQTINAQNQEINKQRINDLENNLKIETMHSMITGQEAERERIAKDLHDSLGGLLSTVKLHFDAIQSHDDKIIDLKEYRKAYTLLDLACSEVRSISNNLQPDAILSMGVVTAIGDLINRVQSDETPKIDFQHFGVSVMEPTVALNIYRIVQELLSNSLKHANSSHILVQLDEKDSELMITVEDDGIGYNPDSEKKGMGTGNIASRVNFLKGDLNIKSIIDEGTSTLITVPLST